MKSFYYRITILALAMTLFYLLSLYIDNIRSNTGRSYFGLPHRKLDPIYTPMK